MRVCCPLPVAGVASGGGGDGRVRAAVGGAAARRAGVEKESAWLF